MRRETTIRRGQVGPTGESARRTLSVGVSGVRAGQGSGIRREMVRNSKQFEAGVAAVRGDAEYVVEGPILGFCQSPRQTAA